MPKRIDITGQTFGELKVIRLSDRYNERNVRLWECLCSCGETTYVMGTSLRAGNYKSCGCKQRKKRDAGARQYEKTDSVGGTRKSALKAKLHKNNKSGVKGVMWMGSRQKWKAYIGFKGKQINLGYFSDKVAAVAARQAAEEKYHKPYLEGDKTTDD